MKITILVNEPHRCEFSSLEELKRWVELNTPKPPSLEAQEAKWKEDMRKFKEYIASYSQSPPQP